MRFLKFTVLHFVINVLPLVLIYLLLPGTTRLVVMLIYLIIYTLVFIYADKFILLFLGAREIIDADNKSLFQVFKGQCFNNYISMPKIYLYSGFRMKAFALDSGKDWVVVLDRNLIEGMNEEQLNSVVDFLLKIKMSNLARVQTKGMGVVAVILKLNYWFLESVLFMRKGTKSYRVVCFISLMFVKPLLEFIFWITSINKSYPCLDSLKSTYYECLQSKKIDTFSEFIAMHLVDEVNYNLLLIEYLESFPVFENCQFGE